MNKHVKNLSNKIFEIDNDGDFESLCLDIFKFQYKNNLVYQEYINLLGVDVGRISNIKDIIFLPIEFFKTHKVVSLPQDVTCNHIFTSSGTTGVVPSCHYVYDIQLYEKSFIKNFRATYGAIEDYVILGLLPSYLERSGSSLIYMVKSLIAMSRPESGFYLYNYEELINLLLRLHSQNIPVILIGVTFALLTLAERYNVDLEEVIIIETGGMKGHGKEITREELHNILRQRLNSKHIHSEYGMTELLSQAYCTAGDHKFSCPSWMKTFLRDPNDPFCYTDKNSSGAINIIDLANIYSCSFLQTNDLGRKDSSERFEVIGRHDNSEVRGCNLLVG